VNGKSAPGFNITCIGIPGAEQRKKRGKNPLRKISRRSNMEFGPTFQGSAGLAFDNQKEEGWTTGNVSKN
jgi:hypothetical protein